MRNKTLMGVVCGLAGMLFAIEGWTAPFVYVTNNTADGLVHVIDTAMAVSDPANAVVDSFLVASAPVRILLSPDGRKAFVSNSGSDSVSIADLVSSTVTAVRVGVNPFAMAVTPDGKKLYVVNNGSATVSVIEVETATETAVINVGGGPKDVKITPDGKTAVVVNETDGTAVMIDTAADTASPPVTVGTAPVSLVITPDGAKAYVANSDSDNVSVIDLTDNQTAAIGVGDQPHFIVVTPDGTSVLAANTLGDTVSIIETAGDTVVCNVAVGNGPSIIIVNSIGTLAYVSDTLAGAVSVVDIAGCSEVSPRVAIAGNAQTVDLAITSDDAFVYAVNRAIDTVSVISAADNTVAATITVPSIQVGSNTVDPAPWVIAMSPPDTDADGYGDPGDNCPTIANPDQANTEPDPDFAGDLCSSRPLNLSATATTNVISLTWEEPSGVTLGDPPVVVSAYNIYLDGVKVAATTDGTTLTADVSGLSAETNYLVGVTGVDDQGNESAPTEISVSTVKALSGGGGGGRCFIATAAFGSPMEPRVQLLREFRDRILNAFAPGRALIKLYERFSPPLADFISERPALRAATRAGLLPFIGISWWFLKAAIWMKITSLVLFAGLIGIVVAAYQKRKPVL